MKTRKTTDAAESTPELKRMTIAGILMSLQEDRDGLRPMGERTSAWLPRILPEG
jgi:hypothetical protein